MRAVKETSGVRGGDPASTRRGDVFVDEGK